MSSHIQLTSTFVVITTMGAGSAAGETTAVYNESCQSQVTALQQASNADDVTSTRHALLLCLADEAYFDATQTASDYGQWGATRHFQVFATQEDVKVADVSFSGYVNQTGSQNSRNAGGGMTLLGGGAERCTCPAPVVTRGTGDPTDPVKSEGLDIYFTMNLGDLLADGPDGINQMKSFLDEVQATGVTPLASEQRAASVIARFGDLDQRGTYDLGSSTLNFDGTPSDDWDPQVTVDWSSAFLNNQSKGLGSSCVCPHYQIPIDRSGGDKVPFAWREAEDHFFSTNDPLGLIESMTNQGFDQNAIQGQGGQ